MNRLIVGLICSVLIDWSIAGPAIAQRACQADDIDCIEARTDNQRSRTLWRLQVPEGQRRANPQPTYQREQLRRQQLRARGNGGTSGCDVKPVISGQDTRVVPACR